MEHKASKAAERNGVPKVKTWNVNGAERYIERIVDLQNECELDVLVITRT